MAGEDQEQQHQSDGEEQARATLVLDMRGTLMSQISPRHITPELVAAVITVDTSLLMLKRPHVDHFLEQMARVFDVIAFTSSGRKLADKILDVLDPTGKLLSLRLYQDSCKQSGAIKDLSVLGRPLERVVIVDDSCKKCLLNLDNLVPIPTFKRDLDDSELLRLLPFLESLAEAEDVRPVIRSAFGPQTEAERLAAILSLSTKEHPENRRMKGHQAEGSGRITALGRILTKILRHRAVEMGLELRRDGFSKVSDLLRLDITTRSKVPLSSHTVEDVLEAVEKDSKQRLSIMVDKDNQLYIRANQGHSIDSVSSQHLLREVKSADEIPACVHGTLKEALPSILKEGLKPMGRKHVHFATSLPDTGAVTSGIRSNSEVLIFLDVAKAIQGNLKLYISENNVVLTEATVPSEFFQKVVEWPSNKLLIA